MLNYGLQQVRSLTWQYKGGALRAHIKEYNLKIIAVQSTPENWLRGAVFEENCFEDIYFIYSSRYTKGGTIL